MKRVHEILRFLKIAEQLETNAHINKEDVPIISKILDEYIKFHETAFLPDHEKNVQQNRIRPWF